MNIESTIEEPILFFEDFFLENGYNNLKRGFFTEWEGTKEIYPENVEIYDSEEYIVHYFALDERNQSFPTKLLFIDELKRLFIKEVQKSKRYIKKGTHSFIYRGISQLNYLSGIKRTILHIFDGSFDLLNKYPFCRTKLESLSTLIDMMITEDQSPSQASENSEGVNLANANNPKAQKNSIDKKNKPSLKPPFFATGKLDYDFFNSLTHLFYQYSIVEFPDEFVKEVDKIFAIFKSPEPWESGLTIQFSFDNLEVVLILDELGSIIANLNPTTIAKSKCFLGLKNKLPFKRADLYSARTTIMGKRKLNPNWTSPVIQPVILAIKKLAKKYQKSPSSKSQSPSQPLS